MRKKVGKIQMNTLEMIKTLCLNKNLRATTGETVGKINNENETIGSNTIGWHENELCWLKPDGSLFNLFSLRNEERIFRQWKLL